MASNHPEDASHREHWDSIAIEFGLAPEPKPTPAVAENEPEPKPMSTPSLGVGERVRCAEKEEAVKQPISVRRIAPPVVAPSLVSKSQSVGHYKSLFRRYRGQSGSGVFASHYGSTWEAPYECLAHMAKKENWQFVRPAFQRSGVNYPILKEYLNNTFLRLHEQKKNSILVRQAECLLQHGPTDLG